MSDSQSKTDRGSTWDDEVVIELINIWADERIQQQLDGCTRKRPSFEKMAKTLAEAGFARTFSQVREKIKQLKQNYKKVEDNNNNLQNIFALGVCSMTFIMRMRTYQQTQVRPRFAFTLSFVQKAV